MKKNVTICNTENKNGVILSKAVINDIYQPQEEQAKENP